MVYEPLVGWMRGERYGTEREQLSDERNAYERDKNINKRVREMSRGQEGRDGGRTAAICFPLTPDDIVSCLASAGRPSCLTPVFVCAYFCVCVCVCACLKNDYACPKKCNKHDINSIFPSCLSGYKAGGSSPLLQLHKQVGDCFFVQ